MSWRDRDYHRDDIFYGPNYAGAGRSRPWGGSIVTTLIVVNVAVYVLAQISQRLLDLIYSIGAMQAEAVLHGQLWRLITAQYLHGGTGHLLLNMLGLHFLGRPLEQMWSAKKLFTIYTLCGLFGNVFYTILGARGVIPPEMPAVGASGSIYGLMGILAVLFPHATVYIQFLFPVRIRTAAFIFGGIALLSIIERGSNYGGEACHLAGLVFGVWWAMRGERWWGSTEWRRGREMSGGKRSARTIPFRERAEAAQTDAETVDRILKKVYERGIFSLSDAEKEALRLATERQRAREAGAGRVDRI